MSEEYTIDQDDFVGVGSGAFSCVGDQMYSTEFSLNHHCRRLEGGHSGIAQLRRLGRKERMRCDCLLRPCSGALRREDIATRHGAAFWLRITPELVAMRPLGATRHDADALRLTRRGMYCSVPMMDEFLNRVNDVREHARAELDACNEEANVPVSASGGIPRGQGLAPGGGR